MKEKKKKKATKKFYVQLPNFIPLSMGEHDNFFFIYQNNVKQINDVVEKKFYPTHFIL